MPASPPDGPPALAGLAVLVIASQPITGEALAALLAARAGASAAWIQQEELSDALKVATGPVVLLWCHPGVDRESVRSLAGCWNGRAPGIVLLADELDRETMLELASSGTPGFAIVRPSGEPSIDDFVHALNEVRSGRSSVEPSMLSSVLCNDVSRMSGLTDAEREVAELVAQGLRNETIGKRLCKSERTVEKHVASVFDKFGLNPGLHGHLDRRVAAARIVLAAKAGESLGPDALGETPL